MGNQNTFFIDFFRFSKLTTSSLLEFLPRKLMWHTGGNTKHALMQVFGMGRDDTQKSRLKSIFFFTSQLNQLIEAEPVLDLERLRYRGLLSAHIPQDIKARFLSFLVKSYIYTYNIYNTYLYTPLCSVLIYLKISKPGLSLSWSKLYYQSVLQLSRVQVLDLAKMGTRVTCLFVVAK